MLSQYSAKRPLTIIVAVILAIVIGVVSFTKLPADLLPDFDLPYAVVATTYPGASPEKVEISVTKPLEAALSSTGGIKNISSVSSADMSMVILEFEYSTNMDTAMIEMDSSIDRVKPYFDDSVSAPMLMRIDPSMLPLMVLALSVEGMDKAQASAYMNDTVIPALERVEGVAQISCIGLVEDSVSIKISDEKLKMLKEKLIAAVDEGMSDAEAELRDAQDKLNSGKREMESQLNEQERQLQNAEKQTSGALEQIALGISQLDSAQKDIDAQRVELERRRTELEAQISELGDAAPQTLRDALAGVREGIAGADAASAELASKRRELETKKAEAESGAKNIESGKTALAAARGKAQQELGNAQSKLDSAKEQLDEARDEAIDSIDVESMVNADIISSMLKAQNFSMPAGYSGEDTVKVGDAFGSIDELSDMVLFESGTESVGSVRLIDVADITMTDNAQDMFAQINGSDGILMTITKQSGASSTEVSSKLRDAIERLRAENTTLNVTSLSDQGVYIDIIVESVLKNLLMGAVLAVLVLLLFLRRMRPTLIVALSIPVSLLLSLSLMYFSGITLNIISLAGLALGIGMLVDNSIVVIENIYRIRGEGKGVVYSAIHGTKEVGGAIIASTLTTVCVFLPIVFAEGISRELFVDMGLTIAYSLLSSLLVAMTVVPALGSLMLTKEPAKHSRFFKRVLDIHERILTFTLSHKVVTLILTAVLFGVSVFGAYSSGTAFMPQTDAAQIAIMIETPKTDTGEEMSSDEKRELAVRFAESVMKIEGVDTVGVMEGGSALFGVGGGYSAYVLLSESERPHSNVIQEKILEAAAGIPCEVSISSGNADMSALSGSGIQFNIYGTDMESIYSVAKSVREAVNGVDGIAEVEDNDQDASSEWHVSVDKSAAIKYGLTVAQIYAQIAGALETEKAAATLSVGTREYPVVVVSSDSAQTDLEDIELEGTEDGETVSVALTDIAQIRRTESGASINRENNKRKLTVSATVEAGENAGNVSARAKAEVDKLNLPEDINIEMSGESTTINETLTELLNMGLLALLLIYLIMVAQFRSLLSPFIIMFTVPLAFTGGLLLQWSCNMELSVMSALGLLVLLGVVVNNGIVLIDCANTLYMELGDRRKALIEASRRRMRPILMTALTTVLGLVTLAFGVGQGADMLQPMGIVIIGGLTYGTLLTLFVIPVLYDLLCRKQPKEATEEI